MAEAAHYDASLGAWVLSRYRSVAAALRHPAFTAGGDVSGAHRTVRDAAFRDGSAALCDDIERSAREAVAHLPADRPMDLVSGLARPWSFRLAAAGSVPSSAASLAATVFEAAARATSADLPRSAQEAAAELARLLPPTPSAVQSFVALSETLPAFLGAAWLELIAHPDCVARLRSDPEVLPRAVDELLRHSGPSRAVFRQASEPVTLDGASIERGQRVILLLGEANRDPAAFPDPGKLDFDRAGPPHLGFGAGPHTCPGAAIIHRAAAALTAALLDRAPAIALAGEPRRIDGFAIGGVASLPVILHSEAARPAAGNRA